MSQDNQNLQKHIQNHQLGVRRSHRPRIPNNIYTQDITQSKRGLNLKDSKKKISRTYDSQESFLSSKRVQSGSVRSYEGQWIKCLLPIDEKTTKQYYVQIVLSKNPKRKHSEFCEDNKGVYNKFEESIPNQIPKKMKKKSSNNGGPQKPGLLELLYQAAHKVANQDSEIQVLKKTTHCDEAENASNDKALINSQKKQNKETKDDRQGKILRTYISDEKLIFEHSKRGNSIKKSIIVVEVPFDRKDDIIRKPSSIQIQQNTTPSLEKNINLDQVKVKFDEYKKKHFNSLILI